MAPNTLQAIADSADVVAAVSENLINGVAAEFFAANPSMFKGSLQFQEDSSLRPSPA